jgi:plasmid stabilization system protein ParE
MARVQWAESARAALDRLILSHSLPADTPERIKASLQPLARFPRLGPEITRLAAAEELRFVIGPWPWLVLVYLYDDRDDRVTVVSVEDGRAATSTVARRRIKDV